ncbi:energy transducer TonB [Flammeovirga aprica]|uniref:TonB family protein n=1 Tax=Flammeovirga aprica JL-4 TaxID=694437 RepID=A0A7X9RTB7_9BACT|nr:energy transducer TonB [Flammeovirga aprica]NME67037.1 TonB family protein [Flammeovirga aprica JL-4]
MKQGWLTLLLTFYTILSFAQTKIFLDSELKEAKPEQEADYFIISKKGKKVKDGFQHTIHFLSGEVYVIYNTSKPNFKAPKEGAFVTYFKNGNKKLEGEYRQRLQIGVWKLYHENGQANLEYEIKNKEILLLNGWDELGKQTLKGGNGYIKYITNKSDNLGLTYGKALITVEGKVKNKQRDQFWEGKYISSGKKYFEETYKNGKLKKGVSWDKHQNQFSYTKSNVSATYPGGNEQLYKHLGKAIRYPQEAKANGERGKVHVQFVVLQTGKVSNLKIVKGVSESINEEVLRVMALLPDWEAAQLKGKPIKQRMRLPVTFDF